MRISLQQTNTTLITLHVYTSPESPVLSSNIKEPSFSTCLGVDGSKRIQIITWNLCIKITSQNARLSTKYNKRQKYSNFTNTAIIMRQIYYTAK